MPLIPSPLSILKSGINHASLPCASPLMVHTPSSALIVITTDYYINNLVVSSPPFATLITSTTWPQPSLAP
jgi:hypothetical protein